MPVISVIIPVYNCEKYLPATLDAVLNQTFSDFEIIAVNNSSPDGCLRILQDYAERDARIRVLSHPNGGAGTARNAALEIARGDFAMATICCRPKRWKYCFPFKTKRMRTSFATVSKESAATQR